MRRWRACTRRLLRLVPDALSCACRACPAPPATTAAAAAAARAPALRLPPRRRGVRCPVSAVQSALAWLAHQT